MFWVGDWVFWSFFAGLLLVEKPDADFAAVVLTNLHLATDNQVGAGWYPDQWLVWLCSFEPHSLSVNLMSTGMRSSWRVLQHSFDSSILSVDCLTKAANLPLTTPIGHRSGFRGSFKSTCDDCDLPCSTTSASAGYWKWILHIRGMENSPKGVDLKSLAFCQRYTMCMNYETCHPWILRWTSWVEKVHWDCLQ